MLTRQSILRAEYKLITALRENDAQAFSSCLHDDLVFRIPSGDIIDKQSHVESLDSGNLIITDLSVESEKVQIIANNAIVTMIKRMRGSYKNEAFFGYFHYLRVWQIFDDKLLVIGGVGQPIEKYNS